MKILVYNKSLKSIQVEVETPYELRGLYVFLQLISFEEFKIVDNAIGDFDALPGLGEYCREDISENPIRAIYGLLMNGIDKKPPTQQEVNAIILACKKAIVEYNKKLLKFFMSELQNPDSELYLHTTLLIKATSRKVPLTKEEFMNDSYMQCEEDLSPSEKEEIYKLYQLHQSVITGFSPIDIGRGVNIVGLIKEFSELVDTIARNEYMHDDTVKYNGIHYKWNEKYVQPTLFGSLVSVGTGLGITAVRSAYDVIFKPAIEANSVLLRVAIDNAIYLSTMLTLTLVSRKATNFKIGRDENLMHVAVAYLADNIPEYKKLLIEKGFVYTKGEITFIDEPEDYKLSPI